MQDFKGDGSVTLDMFSDQVNELSRFYHWDEQETCRQARAHLRGTTLAYVRRAPFPLRSWEELKTFLLGIGNHELSVQMGTNSHGHRRMKDILQAARSLGAVEEDEKFHP